MPCLQDRLAASGGEGSARGLQAQCTALREDLARAAEREHRLQRALDAGSARETQLQQKARAPMGSTEGFSRANRRL